MAQYRWSDYAQALDLTATIPISTSAAGRWIDVSGASMVAFKYICTDANTDHAMGVLCSTNGGTNSYTPSANDNITSVSPAAARHDQGGRILTVFPANGQRVFQQGVFMQAFYTATASFAITNAQIMYSMMKEF